MLTVEGDMVVGGDVGDVDDVVQAPDRPAGMQSFEAEFLAQGLRPMLAKTCGFLQAIGLPVRVVDKVNAWIMDGEVAIENGGLLITPRAIESDLLHEAGHLAVLPSWVRPQASGNIGRVQKTMLEATDFSDPDGSEAVAAIQCGDPETTAWAWAAGQALGLPADVVIRDQDYDNTGEIMRLSLSCSSYLGIQGLSRARWCAVRSGPYAQAARLPVYPRLNRWLQA